MGCQDLHQWTLEDNISRHAKIQVTNNPLTAIVMLTETILAVSSSDNNI